MLLIFENSQCLSDVSIFAAAVLTCETVDKILWNALIPLFQSRGSVEYHSVLNGQRRATAAAVCLVVGLFPDRVCLNIEKA